jgi:hypothetical protein
MTNKAALRWELAGVAVIFLTGSALHSVFDWTGHWRPIAWFAPVNESVWEHFRLAFWPGVLYAMLEYLALRRSVNIFWVGKKEGRNPTVEQRGANLKRFAIAGKDKKWVWADAKIDGETVVVSSPEVPEPVAVRYAFSVNPEGRNLYNKEGLPASPFRTDDWQTESLFASFDPRSAEDRAP